MSEFDMYSGDHNDRSAMAAWDRKYLYGDTDASEASIIGQQFNELGAVLDALDREPNDLD
jgi:hypothetical protein